MRCSICIATHNKHDHLARVLASIARQIILFEHEVIVVDDGSENGFAIERMCQEHGMIYLRIERAGGYRNPSIARNLAYRRAQGEIIITQSDDVEHQGEAVTGLVEALKPGTFVLGTVYSLDPHTRRPVETGDKYIYCSPSRQRMLFFLGALWRADLYAIGGNEELFTGPGGEDSYFTDCLTRGLGLTPVYLDKVVGHHLHHDRPRGLKNLVRPSLRLRNRLRKRAEQDNCWIATGGPWPYP